MFDGNLESPLSLSVRDRCAAMPFNYNPGSKFRNARKKRDKRDKLAAEQHKRVALALGMLLVHTVHNIRYSVAVALIEADFRGGSAPGRPKSLGRLPCRWISQYFGETCVYSDKMFRDVFAVPKVVYYVIFRSISPHIPGGIDAVGLRGISPEIQILLALRLMRTALPCAQLDDQVGYSRETIRIKFRKVICLIVEFFRDEYVPFMRKEDLVKELKLNEKRDVRGCGGSIDCFHVARKVSKVSQGITKQGGKEGRTTSGIQIVAYQNLMFADIHVHTRGSDNDINKLWGSNLFKSVLSGKCLWQQHSGKKSWRLCILLFRNPN